MTARRNRITAYAHAAALSETATVTPQSGIALSNMDAEAATFPVMRKPAEPQPPELSAVPESLVLLGSDAAVVAAVASASADAAPAPMADVEVSRAGHASPATETATSDGAAAEPTDTLTAAVRILPAQRERDRTFLIALGLVLLAHVGFVAGTLTRGAPPPPDGEREQERRGQVEVSETITVELVEEPDGASKSKQSQIGEDAPPAPQSPTEPTPPTPPSEAEKAEQQQPEEPKPAEPEKPVEQAKPTAQPKRAPPPDAAPELSLEDFDTTMDEYAAAVERAQAERRRQADPRSAEAQRIKGAAAQGKQSAYSKSVTTALARNKPKGYLTRGGVYVQFELTMTGALRYVRVVQSSGDPLLDQTGIDAVKKTPFPVPPADVDPRDLRYTIHYVFN